MLTIEQLIQRIELTPKELRIGAGPEVTKAIESELRATIAAGQTPDGQAWLPRQDNGARPLQHAADELRITSLGNGITVIRVKGWTARHHLGAVRGRIKRQVIPTRKSGIPAAWRDAIKRVLSERFQKVMSGEVAA